MSPQRMSSWKLWKSAVGTRAKARRPARLRLEKLENRLLPATTNVISTYLPTVVNSSGSALSFNGSSDYLITPELHSAFSNNSVSIELWFKANAPGVIVTELGTTTINNSTWHDSQVEILSSGQVDARVWNLPAVNLGTVSFGTWNFVALRYNSTTSTLDGVLNGIASSTTVSGTRTAPINNTTGVDGPVLRVRSYGQHQHGQRRLVQR